MSDGDLMGLQAAALFRYNAAGRLVSTNEPGPSRGPRLFVGRTQVGNIWRLRDDLPGRLAADLDGLLAQEPAALDLRQPPACLDAAIRLLETQAPVQSLWMGPAWHFPATAAPPTGAVPIDTENHDLLGKHFPEWTAQLPYRQPCMAVVEHGSAVSICCCARLSPDAAEAGVETAAEYRGRGYAAIAAAAWATAIRDTGRHPLYSTSWDNAASQKVAAKLGLILYGADLSIT